MTMWKKSTKSYVGLWGIVLLLNVLFWNSVFFSDFYVANIFPIWEETYGRVTGLFPFSVGEWMILLGVGILVLCVPCGILACVSQGILWKKLSRGYLHFVAWVILVLAYIMTLNCFSLYHTSPIENSIELAGEEVLTEETMVYVWNQVAAGANELSALVSRDEDGYLWYPEEKPMLEKQAVKEMQKLGDRYERLSGYFPHPKRLFFSDFMCQQYMAGYYFPFSLEANINDVMYVTNKPAAMCHELSHLKGYIRENEANFLSFLACVESDNVLFRYSGYLSVLNYCAREINQLAKEDPSIVDRYEFVKVSKQVQADNIFVLQEDWNRIEEKAIVSTETVDKVSDTFIDTSLKLNGVKEGSHVYSRVVELLMKYYGKELQKKK